MDDLDHARDELVTASHAYGAAVDRPSADYDPNEVAAARRTLEAAQARHAAAILEAGSRAPALPVDVPLEEVSSLHLVSLRIALSIAPQGPRERELMARVDAEIAARQAPAPELAPKPAPHLLPLTHSLRLVPRPFSQLARVTYRLGLDVPCGYAGALSAWPYYHQRRRSCAFAVSPFGLMRAGQRRIARARLRRAALVVTRLPAPFYDRAQVA